MEGVDCLVIKGILAPQTKIAILVTFDPVDVIPGNLPEALEEKHFDAVISCAERPSGCGNYSLIYSKSLDIDREIITALGEVPFLVHLFEPLKWNIGGRGFALQVSHKQVMMALSRHGDRFDVSVFAFR